MAFVFCIIPVRNVFLHIDKPTIHVKDITSLLCTVFVFEILCL